jgi:xylose isomerase
MAEKKSYHSICRWTFNPGKGGFTPADMRPAWGGKFTTADMVRLVAEKIKPKMPDWVELGLEVHYDLEINEANAADVTAAMKETGIPLAMITPGAHSHFGYGGICSLDPNERKAAEELGEKTVDLAYGPMRDVWHDDQNLVPSLILWNGSFGYDIATPGIWQMYQNLKESVAKLCKYEAQKGDKLYIGFEPKPNEGHPAMLIPTVASALLFWRRIEEEFGVSRNRKGVNKEFGHSEMIGLDHVYDSVEELDNNAMVHVHLNSQGYNDGIILGGPGKFDIDHGTRVNGMNIAIAQLMRSHGFNRWKGHDMQPRAYDNEQQAIDRVVRSVLSWEACDKAAAEIDEKSLMTELVNRNTARAEDIMRHAVVNAQNYFDQMYQ